MADAAWDGGFVILVVDWGVVGVVGEVGEVGDAGDAGEAGESGAPGAEGAPGTCAHFISNLRRNFGDNIN